MHDHGLKIVWLYQSLFREAALLLWLVVTLVIVLVIFVSHVMIASYVGAVRRIRVRKDSTAMRLRHLADRSHFAIAIVDLDTLIVLSANRHFAASYGRTQEEVIGTRFFTAACEVQLLTSDSRSQLSGINAQRDCLGCYPCISRN